MPKNIISKISNAFSTGGGGVNFEQQIQAMFLLSLIVDGFCPAMNEKTKEVCFQAKHKGFDTDDLVVFTYRNQSEGKLLCQVKHSITATKNDRLFQEVICAAWNDFNKECFDKEDDRIALATAHIAYDAQQALKFLHAQALETVDERDFLDKVNYFPFSNKKNKEMLDAIRFCISKANGNVPSELELWKFCKVFLLFLFDLDYAESVNRTLATALIHCNSSADPILVWSRLVEYASDCNQNAASINRNNIASNVIELFPINRRIQKPVNPIEQIDDFFMPTIALIGAWQEENKFDQQVIEKITELSYREFIAKAQMMIYKYPEYFRLDNGSWKIMHKEELLNQCRSKMFDDCLLRVIQTAQIVYIGENNNQFIEQSLFAATNVHNNSTELRKSIATSLCWIKSELHGLPNCDHDKIENSLYRFIRNIFEDADYNTWIGIKDCIQCFAEIAPEIFLQKIEWTILHRSQEVLQLFPKKNGGLLEHSNNISELLWAIESLAWSPDYLIPSICVLGQLEALPYEKTTWVNTPINSIVAILLPWYPQTLANLEKRKNALKCLKRDNALVFWRVLKLLLPNQTDSTYSSSKPRYMSLDIPEKIEASDEELREMYSFCLEMAVDMAQNEMDKLIFLTKQMEYMSDVLLCRYIDYIDKCKETSDDQQRLELWLNLQKSEENIRSNLNGKQQLDRIQKVIKSLEPQNICFKYQELYLGERDLLKNDEFEKNWRSLEKEKEEAIREIFVKYGIKATENYGISVKETYDVANKLGRSLTVDEFSAVIDEYYMGEISSAFFISCMVAFVSMQGVEQLVATSLSTKDKNFILKVLTKLDFKKELLEVVNKLLPNEPEYWTLATMPFYCDNGRLQEMNLIVEKLVEHKRYVTAVNIVGRSDFESVMDAEQIYNLLELAGTKKSIGSETIDDYAIQKIFNWFQKQDSIPLDMRSDMEFIYLPLLDRRSTIKPKALYARISMEPEYFCSLIEQFYKKRSDEISHHNNMNELMQERLFKILFSFKVVPGVNLDGDFDEKHFKKWFDTVKTWSIDNDRYEVTMQTVGSGLSYAKLDNDKLPPKTIIEELNMAENEELRRGYYLGVVNQRGVHWVDPEGKPELELAADYTTRADKIEEMGYSRFASVLNDIANQYKREADHNIKYAKLKNNDEDDI